MYEREIVAEDPSPGKADPGTEVVQSETRLQELLEGLQAGDPATLGGLSASIDDARVRSALLETARTVSTPILGSIAQVLGSRGVTAATDTLRHRLMELASDTRAYDDDPFFNARAGTLVTVATAVLQLSPATREAMETLVRLVEHPNSFNRQTAAAELSEVLLTAELPEDMADLGRTKLPSLLSSNDAGLFAAVAPAMAAEQADLILARCEVLLRSPAPSDRELSVAVLSKLKEPRAHALLIAQVSREQERRLACRIAAQLGDAMPKDTLADLAKTALSDDRPSIRHDGLRLLALLSPKVSRSLARDALQDEPDSFVRLKLEELAVA